jgi:hypothetical protein
MTWFDFPGGWGLYNLNGVSEKELVATGAHGYGTKAQAQAHPNKSPSPAQELLLQTLKVSSQSPVGGGISGDLQTPSSGTGGGDILNSAVKFISQSSLWTRVVEIGAGMLLLYAGVKALVAPEGQNIARSTLRSSLSTGKNYGASSARSGASTAVKVARRIRA